MTVIAIKNYTDKILLAADGMATCGDMVWSTEEKKISQVGDLIVAVGGGCAVTTQFHTYMQEMNISSENAISSSFLTEKVLEFHQKYNLDWAKEVYIEAFIADTKHHVIYEINGASVIEIKSRPFGAIGSGYQFAMGCLSQGATPLEAVRATCELSTSCGGSIVDLYVPYMRG